MKAHRMSRVQRYCFFNLRARCGWVVNATPGPLYSLERDAVPTVLETGWVPGPVWTGAENLAPLGFLFVFSCTLYFICTWFFVSIVL